MSSMIEIENDDRYKNGKIYKIVDRNNENIYIGSTIQSLNIRLSQHKCVYKRKENGIYSFITSFNIIKNDDFYIELIEEYPCNNRYELELRERFHIDNNNCVNFIIPTRTIEEWNEENREELLEYHKQYNLEHIDEIKEQMKQHYLEHRDEKLEYQKQYNLQHRDEYLKYQKQRYLKNRENILEKAKVKVRCDICKCEVNKSFMNSHVKTKKHHKNLARIQGRTILFNNNQ
jgi:hypothetical protein